MSKHGYRRLPVEKDGKLVGIISIGDLAQVAKCSGECMDSLHQAIILNQRKKFF